MEQQNTTDNPNFLDIFFEEISVEELIQASKEITENSTFDDSDIVRRILNLYPNGTPFGVAIYDIQHRLLKAILPIFKSYHHFMIPKR